MMLWGRPPLVFLRTREEEHMMTRDQMHIWAPTQEPNGKPLGLACTQEVSQHSLPGGETRDVSMVALSSSSSSTISHVLLSSRSYS
eukprot:9075449-Prorocentrum_lima.AAC.1